MGVGLDLGAGRFRSLRRQDRRLIARQTSAAYSAVEATIDHARLLSQTQLPVLRCQEALLVAGNEAEAFASAFNQPLIPLFIDGHLPEADPIARQVAAERLASILEQHGPEVRERCSVVMPQDAGPGSPTHDYFHHLLRLHGYAPQSISAAQAVGLAELGPSAFAGVVLCFGASSAALALVERGQIATLVDVPCGGDWIDRSLAEQLQQFLFDRGGVRYLDTVSIARWKQSPERSLTNAASQADHRLQHAYTEIVTALLARFQRAIVREGMNGPRRSPLSIVCHGGCTRINGFLPFWNRLWQQAEIDLTVGPARTASDDNWTVARGCLIHSEVAADSHQTPAAA